MREGRIIRVIFLLVLILLWNGTGRAERKGKVVVLRYANWEVLPEQLKVHKEIVDEFNRLYKGKIKVNFIPVYGGLRKILVDIAGRAAPDLFILNIQNAATFFSRGVIRDLTPFIEKDIKEGKLRKEDYFKVAWDSVRIKNRIWGFPLYSTPVVLAYNQDLFDKAGLDYPDESWTWEDFLEAAKKLTVSNKGPYKQFGAVLPAVDRVFIIIRDFGGRLINENFTEIFPDEEATRKSLTFLYNLRWKYKVIPSVSAQASIGGEGAKGAIELFMTGRVGMILCPSFYLQALKKIKDFRWDVAPLPSYKGRERKSYLGAIGMVISSQSKYPEEAWKFIRFIAGEEQQKKLARVGYVVSLKKVAYSDFAVPPPPNIRYFVDAIDDYHEPFPLIPWYTELRSLFQREFERLMLNMQDVDTTIENLKKATKKLLK